MTLADVSFWLALCNSQHQFHRSAAEWFYHQPEDGSVLFCRSTQQSLLRLLTTQAVMHRYEGAPMTNAAAWRLYRDILGNRRCGYIQEPDGIDEWWERFAKHPSPSPKLWMDAYLAAFAVCGGLAFVTMDAGFRQFIGLKLIVLPR